MSNHETPNNVTPLTRDYQEVRETVYDFCAEDLIGGFEEPEPGSNDKFYRIIGFDEETISSFDKNPSGLDVKAILVKCHYKKCDVQCVFRRNENGDFYADEISKSSHTPDSDGTDCFESQASEHF